MQQSSTYRMQLKERICLTDAACDEQIIKISIAPLPGESLQPLVSGQYVCMGIPQLKDPAPAYFAVASSPYDTDAYEFVIKCTSGMAEKLAELDLESQIEVEGPMGKGFDLSGFKGKDIILMGVGTGIAPLRSVWRTLIQERENYGKISIYAGFLSTFHRLLTDEMDELADHNIDVSISLTTGHEDWSGPVGYVQHALEDDEPSGENTVVCLAGMSAMVDACTETLHNLGFNDDHILRNF
ncbi:MAG: hydrogenase [Mariprofundaceae bacterium]|nr:hydrogenase [Mariprofundaceae bacterium]